MKTTILKHLIFGVKMYIIVSIQIVYSMLVKMLNLNPKMLKMLKMLDLKYNEYGD